MVSEPSAPYIVSAPAPPDIISSCDVPMKLSAPSVPTMLTFPNLKPSVTAKLVTLLIRNVYSDKSTKLPPRYTLGVTPLLKSVIVINVLSLIAISRFVLLYVNFSAPSPLNLRLSVSSIFDTEP